MEMVGAGVREGVGSRHKSTGWKSQQPRGTGGGRFSFITRGGGLVGEEKKKSSALEQKALRNFTSI